MHKYFVSFSHVFLLRFFVNCHLFLRLYQSDSFLSLTLDFSCELAPSTFDMPVFRKSPSSRHTDSTRDLVRSRSNREQDTSRDRSAVDRHSSDHHRVDRRRTPDRRRERDRTPDRHRPMSPDRIRFVLLLEFRLIASFYAHPHRGWGTDVVEFNVKLMKLIIQDSLFCWIFASIGLLLGFLMMTNFVFTV